MASRTFTEIVSDLVVYILRQNKKADISSGQVIRDVSINSAANVMADLYANIDQIRNAQSVVNASTMSVDDMNKLVANYGVVRKTATQAQCLVTFYMTSQPTTDITIPAGTRVATLASGSTPQIVFSTVSSATLFAQFEATYFNPDNGYWEIQVATRAEIGGVNSNVGPYTVTKLLTGNLPFSVLNKTSAFGGTDQETNTQLAIRAVNSFQGNNKGTKNGYLGTVLSQPNVLDALVQGPGDPLMIRDGSQGGKVDIWTLTAGLSATQLTPTNNNALTVTWNNVTQSLGGYRFDFPSKPVDVDATLAVVATTGPADPLINVLLYESRNPAPSDVDYAPAGTYHYTFYKANDFDTANSIDANDYIIWNQPAMNSLLTYPSGLNNANTQTLELNVIYSYDKTINDLQTIIDDPANKIITADVLVKSAIKVTIDIQVDVNLEPSYKTTPNTELQTLATIETAIINSINSTKMGTKLEKSDIVQTIHNVAGVDNVVLDSVVITRSINPVYGIAPLEVENTQAFANEYIAAGSVSVNSVATS